MLAAEMRSLYFGELATRATSKKQWVTGSSLLLSSGAAAAFLTELPSWIASAMALVVAGLSAYCFARLDPAVVALVQLHAAWGRIHDDYESLWNHMYADDAEQKWQAIQERERSASELGVAAAPYKRQMLDKWHAWVVRSHFPEETTAA